MKKKQRTDSPDRDGATKREHSKPNLTREAKTKRRAVSRLMAFYKANPLPIPSVSKGKWKKLLTHSTDSETINQKAGDQNAPTQNTKKGGKNTSKGKERNQASTEKDQAKVKKGKRKRKSSKNNENNQKKTQAKARKGIKQVQEKTKQR